MKLMFTKIVSQNSFSIIIMASGGLYWKHSNTAVTYYYSSNTQNKMKVVELKQIYNVFIHWV